MIVTKNTLISELIDENEAAIEAIATVNKNFAKLKNPFLRKMFASRVSIADAAKIGNTSIEAIFIKLEEIGFEIEKSENDKDTIKKKMNIKDHTEMKRNKIVEFDVRPVLEGGVDPFKQIMKKLEPMNDDETLLIINTFEPVPLLNILKTKGYEYVVERPEAGVVYTYLTRIQEGATDEKLEVNESDIVLEFSDIETRFKGKMKEIDVRDLEMPMPMVTILEEIEQVSSNEALYVHHKRLPQYLIPELESRNYKMVSKEIDDDNMKIIIFK